MNKLKTFGISALAGTLVSLSAAQAGGITVTGNWELSYTNLNHEKTSGNKIGMNKNLGFGASGDISDGGGVTWATTLGMSDTAGLSSASMSINMGGIATLAYDSGTGGYGANAVDNIVPTAWEEIDYGFSTGITDLGAVSASKGVVNFAVKAPTAGTGISYSYVKHIGAGHVADGATTGEASGHSGMDVVLDFVDYDAKHFGFRWGMAGEMEIARTDCHSSKVNNQNVSCSGVKNNPYGASMYNTLKVGPISLGVQATFKDPQLSGDEAVANKRSIVAGAAFLVGDTISFSYGEAWDRYKYNEKGRGLATQLGGIGGESPQLGGDAHEYQTIKFRGWSAAWNYGALALKATKNNVGGAGENGSSAPRSHSEVNLSLAF